MIKTIKPEDISDNAIKMINKDYMLITACTKTQNEDGSFTLGRANTMTASWGALGELWNKPVATVYIRPSRYTKEIVDNTDTFSLCVLPQKYKSALDYCGCHSGRDEDKFSATKLELEYMNETPWIKQSRLVLFCRKLYASAFDPYSFCDEKVLKQNYKKDDFHTMYIGEIFKVYEDKHQ